MAAMHQNVIYKQCNMLSTKYLKASPRNANFMFHVRLRLAYIGPYGI
jgi:hypothetical protein